MDTIKKRQDDATSSETLADLEDESTLATDDTDDTDQDKVIPAMCEICGAGWSVLFSQPERRWSPDLGDYGDPARLRRSPQWK